jgi:hypothetical protein
LARLQTRFATSSDDTVKMLTASMKKQAIMKIPARDDLLIRIHQEDSARLTAAANAREIEMLSTITGIRKDELKDPAMRRSAIEKHVQTLYRAEKASATLVKEGLTLNTFEPSTMGETAPQARDLPMEATSASTASVPSVPAQASSPSVAATPSMQESPAKSLPPIPTYDKFRERVFQDWSNAFLSFKTNPDREKGLDRVYVEKTLNRALNLIEGTEATMAILDANLNNSSAVLAERQLSA